MQSIFSPDNCCSKASLNSFQSVDSKGLEATLSQAISYPTPRIMGTIILGGESKGEILVLPDSKSVAQVMPISMALE